MTKAINLYWVLVGILMLGIFLLGMDNCGRANKYQKLKGEYEVYRSMAESAIRSARIIILAQDKKIEELDKKIEFFNDIITVKDEELRDKKDELGQLEEKFKTLEECQVKYDKLVEAFRLCESISADKDVIIFSLKEKYDAQVKISVEWKGMYETEYNLRLKSEGTERACGKALKKIRFTSKVKTGIVLGLAGVVLYSIIKE